MVEGQAFEEVAELVGRLPERILYRIGQNASAADRFDAVAEPLPQEGNRAVARAVAGGDLLDIPAPQGIAGPLHPLGRRALCRCSPPTIARMFSKPLACWICSTVLHSPEW